MLLDVHDVCGFADYFVICSGDSDRQIQAIYDEVEHNLKAAGVLPYHCEGVGSGWLLLDYSDVVAHIFSAKQREYYQLDELWHQAKLVLRIQ